MDAVTVFVWIVKVAVALPAGTVTLGGSGNVASAVLLLDRLIVTPSAGATLVRVTVPVALLPPPIVAGFRLTADNATGLTVSVADRLVLLNDAETLAWAAVVRPAVLTGKVAEVFPAATVTLEGTVATTVSLLDSATTTPLCGAAKSRVTVPVADTPPLTVVGFKETDATAVGP